MVADTIGELEPCKKEVMAMMEVVALPEEMLSVVAVVLAEAEIMVAEPAEKDSAEVQVHIIRPLLYRSEVEELTEAVVIMEPVVMVGEAILPAVVAEYA